MSDPFSAKRSQMRAPGFVRRTTITSTADALDVLDEVGALELVALAPEPEERDDGELPEERPLPPDAELRAETLNILTRVRRSIERGEPRPRILGHLRTVFPRLGPDAREPALLLLGHCTDDGPDN